MVDNLKEDEKYWVVDSYDDLGEYFPKVPDVPPSEGKPTYFVAIPRSQIIDVSPNVTLRTDSELEPLKKKYYRGEIAHEELDNQLN